MQVYLVVRAKDAIPHPPQRDSPAAPDDLANPLCTTKQTENVVHEVPLMSLPIHIRHSGRPSTIELWRNSARNVSSR